MPSPKMAFFLINHICSAPPVESNLHQFISIHTLIKKFDFIEITIQITMFLVYKKMFET